MTGTGCEAWGKSISPWQDYLKGKEKKNEFVGLGKKEKTAYDGNEARWNLNILDTYKFNLINSDTCFFFISQDSTFF